MIYVMSDIHGMFDKYQEMMRKIDLKENDTLYVLGDIIKDMMKRPNVFGIFGNHEFMMVNCLKMLSNELTNEYLDSLDKESYVKLSDWIENGALSTIQEFKSLRKEEQEDMIEYLMEFTLSMEKSIFWFMQDWVIFKKINH